MFYYVNNVICIYYKITAFILDLYESFSNNDIKALMLIPAEITCIRLDHNFTLIMIKQWCINSMAAKVLPESLPVVNHKFNIRVYKT